MAGLWDDTLVVYSSDHGGTVGEHRNFDHGSMYEGSIRIPLIFCGPGIQAGIVNSNPVSALDILPTITEAVGYNVPIQMRGNSLLMASEASLSQKAPRLTAQNKVLKLWSVHLVNTLFIKEVTK